MSAPLTARAIAALVSFVETAELEFRRSDDPVMRRIIWRQRIVELAVLAVKLELEEWE